MGCDPDTAAQVVTDLGTSLPYEPPARRAPVDDGVADAHLDRRFLTGGDWWARMLVVDL